MNKQVRLSDSELKIIRDNFKKIFSEGDHLWLFGSRVNTKARGGDIDLYVETQLGEIDDFMKREKDFLISLWKDLGEQKIDIIVNPISMKWPPLEIYRIAKNTGIQLV